ncbi:MAG TPA: tetratricopeptide repeat protein [Polyangiaceae bacterium]|nr:tetratricopeptide repeat protein [Polyangiaceae bacterium]
MSPPDSVDSTRDIASDDFLFHLYRGSELLQDNRILEAKEALEQALTVQPLDPKGQDLLGTVYFRLGLYPRAIHIYEDLAARFPQDVAVKVNLGLCYLKTGQPEFARRTLRTAVEINAEHKRAWGYLGLALQKLGEFEQAQVAFEKGDRPTMARKLIEVRRSLLPKAPDSQPPEITEGVRAMAQTAFSELDAGELQFALAEPASSDAGSWHTLELGGSSRRPRTPPPRSPLPQPVRQTLTQGPHGMLPVSTPPRSPFTKTLPPPWMGGDSLDPPTLPPPSVPGISVPVAVPRSAPGLDGVRAVTVEESGPLPVVAAEAVERGARIVASLLAAPAEASVVRRASGVVVAQTGRNSEHAFAARLDAFRVLAGPVTTRVLHRRARDSETSEVLGGIGSPLVRVAGDGQLALGPRPGHALTVMDAGEALAFAREDLLVGFEMSLAYENGRVELGAAAGEMVPVVQLRGTGSFVLEVPGDLARLFVLRAASGTPLLIRRDWVVAWFGRLVPRVLPSTESPAGHRGLIGFSGDGTVLVNAA